VNEIAVTQTLTLNVNAMLQPRSLSSNPYRSTRKPQQFQRRGWMPDSRTHPDKFPKVRISQAE
jgi:hypothetical protein